MVPFVSPPHATGVPGSAQSSFLATGQRLFQVLCLDCSTISHPGFAFDAADVTAMPIFSARFGSMVRQACGGKCAAVLEEEIVVQIVELCLVGAGVALAIGTDFLDIFTFDARYLS
jgi:hypothetical protein